MSPDPMKVMPTRGSLSPQTGAWSGHSVPASVRPQKPRSEVKAEWLPGFPGDEGIPGKVDPTPAQDGLLVITLPYTHHRAPAWHVVALGENGSVDETGIGFQIVLTGPTEPLPYYRIVVATGPDGMQSKVLGLSSGPTRSNSAVLAG